MSDFIQKEPREGSAATEKTEVWLFFDDDNVYVSFRCWESQPERMVANEMRRDNNNIFQNDHIAFVFDTFYDRRNGVEFVDQPDRRPDGRPDHQRAAVQRATGTRSGISRSAGSTAAGRSRLAIPFKSLRYRPGRAQIWGFNARRVNRWKNEIVVPDAHSRARSARRGHLPGVAGRDASSASRRRRARETSRSSRTRSSDLTSDRHGDAADLERSRTATSAST